MWSPNITDYMAFCSLSIAEEPVLVPKLTQGVVLGMSIDVHDLLMSCMVPEWVLGKPAAFDIIPSHLRLIQVLSLK